MPDSLFILIKVNSKWFYAWEMHWTEKPNRPQSMRYQKNQIQLSD